MPVVGCDVAEEPTLRPCVLGHAAGGHCDRHAVAQAAIVLVDLRLQACGGARELADGGSIGWAYAGRDIADASLAAGCADRNGVGRARHRTLTDATELVAAACTTALAPKAEPLVASTAAL